ADKRVWTLDGDKKVSFTGRLNLNNDGSASFTTKDGNFRRNGDQSTSRLTDKGEEQERKWDNGAYFKRNKDGSLAETRDADGNTKKFDYLTSPDGKPVLDAYGKPQIKEVTLTQPGKEPVVV